MPVFILNTVSIPWHTVKLTSMHVCIKCIKCRYKISDKHHIFLFLQGSFVIITQAHTNISNRLKTQHLLETGNYGRPME